MANIKNLAGSFVVTPPSGTTGTSLTVTASSGAFFPAAPFYATLTPPASLSNPATSEIVLVTAVSTDTFTVTRAQKSTTAQTVSAGWIITNGIYTEDITSSVNLGASLSGTVDGTNKIFTVPQSTSVELFKNGTRMTLGGDYTFINGTTITFVTAPASGAILVANTIIGSQTFSNGSNSFKTDETPTGTVNGSNGVFTTLQPYTPGSLEFHINGNKQKRTIHFTETNPSTGQFTVSDAPLTGDDLMVNYQFASGVSGNADTVDNYHASATPTPNNIPVLDSNGNLPGLSWTTFTPVFSGLNIGNGTVNAAWGKVGKTVFLRFNIVFGSTTSVSGDMQMTLPVPAFTYGGQGVVHVGDANLFDVSAARVYQGTVNMIASGSGVVIRPQAADLTYLYSAVASSSIPFPWASPDEIGFTIKYEAA